MKYLLVLLTFMYSCSFVSAQSRFLPNQLTVQHGGGIGWLSVGVGYKNRTDKFNIALLYGYVPPSEGGQLDIFTLKAGYNPFSIKTVKGIVWKPLNPVAFLSYTTNEHFYTSWPGSRYPDDYYWWSSAFRMHVGLQSSLVFNLPAKACARSATMYIEMSTNDLYISSYLSNRKYLSLYDISVLSAGVKLNLR
ncbi:MAG: hypothetical protein V4651_12965 [Bacteroidota bacterium]